MIFMHPMDDALWADAIRMAGKTIILYFFIRVILTYALYNSKMEVISLS